MAAAGAARGDTGLRAAAAAVAGRPPRGGSGRPPGRAGPRGRGRGGGLRRGGGRPRRRQRGPRGRAAYDVRAGDVHSGARDDRGVGPGDRHPGAGPSGLPGRRLPALGTAPRP